MGVKQLIYRVQSPPHSDYAKAGDLQYGAVDFDALYSKGELEIAFKSEDYDEEGALNLISPFLRTWEAIIGLRHCPGVKFELKHIKQSESTLPTTGFAYMSADCIASRQYEQFPAPMNDWKFGPEVEEMYNRYAAFTERREPLPAMAYFCLDKLETFADNQALAPGVEKTSKRKKASKIFGIEEGVLRKLGELSSTKGGPEEARKANTSRPLSSNEREWLVEAAKLLIWRAGEYCHDPNKSLQLITMNQLPGL
jgi:hypothetical protein